MFSLLIFFFFISFHSSIFNQRQRIDEPPPLPAPAPAPVPAPAAPMRAEGAPQARRGRRETAGNELREPAEDGRGTGGRGERG